MTVRWTLSDGGGSYTFEHNPDKAGPGGEVSFARQIADDYVDDVGGGPSAVATQAPPLQAEFTVTVIDQAQYDALWAWWDTGTILALTDDLGRSSQIYLSEVQATRVWHPNNPWFHTFNVKYFVLSLIDI